MYAVSQLPVGEPKHLRQQCAWTVVRMRIILTENTVISTNTNVGRVTCVSIAALHRLTIGTTMKIEFTIPDDLTLKYIYAPSMVDRGKHAGPGWLVYCTSNTCPTYYGAFGIGPTPQAAVDHALAQANEYLARNPQGAYNVTTGTASPADLDLDFLKGL
jgi:hypothetical protein